VYGAQMVVLPYLIVGSGWVGALASWALVLAASCVVAFGLERWSVTRAVFSGRWPRPKAKTERGATGDAEPASKEGPA